MLCGMTFVFVLHGDELFVSAFAASRTIEQQGTVHRFKFDGTRWTPAGELVSTAPFSPEGFGHLLAIDGDHLAVGTTRDRVHLFRRDATGAWQPEDILRPSSSTYPDSFGFALALQGHDLLVGTPDESDAFGSPVYGAVYQFDLNCGGCTPDLDADGALTIFDYLTFLNLFEDDDAQADFDGDGEFTLFDFLAFQTAFDAGCG